MATRNDACDTNVTDHLVDQEDPLYALLAQHRASEQHTRKNGKTKKDKKKATKKDQIVTKSGNVKTIKWVAEHHEWWRGAKKAGVVIAKRGHYAKPQFLASSSLSARETDLLRVDIVKHAREYDNPKQIFIDVSQGLERYPRQVGSLPCILPGGKIVVVQPSETRREPEVRALFGLEALRLQGLHESLVPSPTPVFSFTDRDLLNLAGNAFSVPHVQLAILCVLTSFLLLATKDEITDRRAEAMRQRRNRLRGKRWVALKVKNA